MLKYIPEGIGKSIQDGIGKRIPGPIKTHYKAFNLDTIYDKNYNCTSGTIFNNIKDNELRRSTVISILNTAILTMIKLKITNPAHVQPLISYICIQMIWGNVVGFLGDQYQGTKEGYALSYIQWPWGYDKGTDIVKNINPDFNHRNDLVSRNPDNGEFTFHGACNEEILTKSIENLKLEPSFHSSTHTGGASVAPDNNGFKRDMFKGTQYAFQKVGSLQFIKFFITVLIDTIISIAIFSILRESYFKITTKKESFKITRNKESFGSDGSNSESSGSDDSGSDGSGSDGSGSDGSGSDGSGSNKIVTTKQLSDDGGKDDKIVTTKQLSDDGDGSEGGKDDKIVTKKQLPDMVNLFFQALIGTVTYKIYVGWSRTYWAYENTNWSDAVESQIFKLMFCASALLLTTGQTLTSESEEPFETWQTQLGLIGVLYLFWGLYYILNENQWLVHGKGWLGVLIFIVITVGCWVAAFSYKSICTELDFKSGDSLHKNVKNLECFNLEFLPNESTPNNNTIHNKNEKIKLKFDKDIIIIDGGLNPIRLVSIKDPKNPKNIQFDNIISNGKTLEIDISNIKLDPIDSSCHNDNEYYINIPEYYIKEKDKPNYFKGIYNDNTYKFIIL